MSNLQRNSKGQFTPGVSGNPRGKRRRSVAVDAKMRREIERWFTENLRFFLQEIAAMPPGHAKVNAITGLLRFVTPQVNSADAEIDITKLSARDIDTLLNRLMAREAEEKQTIDIPTNDEDEHGTK